MSCCVCRLPFLPTRKEASNPRLAHFAPPGILTDDQTAYFEHLVSFGELTPGFLLDCIYFSNNLLGAVKVPSGSVVALVHWEQAQRDSVLATMHKVCYDLFRRCVAPGNNTLDILRKLGAIEYVLRRPLGAENAGRWAGVDYEGVGEKINFRILWCAGFGLGENTFVWHGLAPLGYGWLVNRPDIFPPFRREVDLSRLAGLSDATRGTDILSRQPSDVLRCIAAHVPDGASLARFAAACRFTRFLSLTDWQPIARALVGQTLPWAMPSPSETKASASPLASPDVAGDWMLYLSHVHRTESMRVRRWIWAICEEIKRIVDAKLEATGALQEGTDAWIAVETALDKQWPLYLAVWHPEVVKQGAEMMKIAPGQLAETLSQMKFGDAFGLPC